MNRLEPRSLLPERPTPESWSAFVAVGLIGTYLTTATVGSAAGTTASSLQAFAIVLVALGFLSAYSEASALDDAEGDL
jgi:hypothetical protein